MKGKSRKCIAFTLCLGMILQGMTPAMAGTEVETDASMTISRDLVKLGGDQLYSDKEGYPENPVTLVEVTVDGVSAPVHIQLTNLQETEIYLETDSDESGNAVLEIPDELSGGQYKVSADNGAYSEIQLLNNLALGATCQTDVSPKQGMSIEALTDGTTLDWNADSSVMPSDDNPQSYEINFDRPSDVYGISVWCGYGKTHGIKRAQISYLDVYDGQWKEIGTYSFDWDEDLSDNVRIPEHIDFDKVSTTAMKISILEANQNNWGNNSVMSELQVWGTDGENEGVSSYSLTADKDTVSAGKENAVNITLTGEQLPESVHFELEDEYGEIRASYDAMTSECNPYEFLVPQDTEPGEYTIVATIGEMTDRRLKLTITKPIDAKGNLSSELTLSQQGFTSDVNLEALKDNDRITVWTGTLPDTGTGDIGMKLEAVQEMSRTMVVKNVYLVSDTLENGIANVDVKADCNTKGYYASAADKKENLIWQEQDGQYICRVPLVGMFQTSELKLTLTGDAGSQIRLSDILVDGDLLSDNLLTADAKVTANGNNIDIHGMSGNSMEATTTIPTSQKGQQDMVFAFEGMPAFIDGFTYSVNFPQKQGIVLMDLYCWENEQWKLIQSDVVPKWHDFGNDSTNDQLRQAYQIQFEPVVTSKFRLVAKECPAIWGQLVFEELNLSGKIQVSAQGIADMITRTPQPVVGETQLRFPEIPREYREEYQISIASSSNEDIISKEGVIKPGETAQDVEIIYQISEKEGSDTAVTRSFMIHVPAVLKDDYILLMPQEDQTSFLNNPSMGWVQYVEGFECRKHNVPGSSMETDLCTTDAGDIQYFWKEMDELIEQGLMPSILYMRMQWSWFEPEEGKYAWDDKESELSQLVSGARERGLQLAFRVLVDSTDIGQFQAAPEWLTDNPKVQCWTWTDQDLKKTYKTPYANDPIFIEKYSEFIRAFGEEFDTEDVAYIDTCGMGNWGEMANIPVSSSIDNRSAADIVAQISRVYDEAFENVLLGAQIGGVGSDDAIDQLGFVIRRDSFGSPTWLPQKDINDISNRVKNGNPLFAENCYHHFKTREGRWSNTAEPSYGDDVYAAMPDMMRGVLDDALEARANTLDIRVLEDARMWVAENGENHFIEEGMLNLGYRISPVRITVPEKIVPGEVLEIYHSWKNTGVGILPNENKKWNNKFKVSFSLLNEETGDVVYQFIEDSSKVNPGDWRREDGEVGYTSQFQVPENLSEGIYEIAVGIVNEKLDHTPQIKLAAKLKEENNWSVLGKVQVSNKNSTDKTSLRLAIAMAQNLQKASNTFTEETWNYVEIALKNAEDTDDNPKSSQEEIDSAFLDLITAISGLRTGVQKVGLEAAIAGAEEILSDVELESYYTQESIQNVKKVLKRAKEVLNTDYDDVEEGQRAVNEATTNLITAITHMLRKDITRLQKLIHQAEEILKTSDKYTKETITNLQEALKQAKDIINHIESDTEDYNKAYGNLATALTNLVLKGDKAELVSVIKQAESILSEQEKYFAESLEGLQETLDEAKKVLQDEDATQEEINKAVQGLITQCLEARILGDVDLNGKVNTEDSALLLKYNAEKIDLSTEQLQIADVNKDGVANTDDASRILMFAAEKIESF